MVSPLLDPVQNSLDIAHVYLDCWFLHFSCAYGPLSHARLLNHLDFARAPYSASEAHTVSRRQSLSIASGLMA
ncbi:hypothetical protein Q3G72_015101 [Acer saccharum]|nr:hypothetical protein Q3G72_015101 [Acer saccharum]